MLSQKIFHRIIKTTVPYNEWKRKKVTNLRNNFKFRNLLAKEPDDTSHHLERIVSADLLEQSEKKAKYVRNETKSDRFVQNQTKSSRYVKNQQRPDICYKGELLYGTYPVYLALMQQKRHFHHLFIKYLSPITAGSDNTAIKDEIKKLGFSLGIRTTYVTNQDLQYLAPDAIHQGICLDVSAYPLIEPEETVKIKLDTSCSNFPIWLVLDEIQDPMNMGAILRSAYYFGVDKLFLTAENSCKLSPTVSKASSGALEILDIYKVSDLFSFLKNKKLDGWDIISTTIYKPPEENENLCERSVNLSDYNVVKPTILILGNECKGISPPLMSLCDHLLSIYPPKKLHMGIDSLNVSVATGILLHHLLHAKKPVVL